MILANDNSTRKQATVLIVDDMPWQLTRYREEFEKAGMKVISLLSCAVGEKPDAVTLQGASGYFTKPEEFAALLAQHKPDAVLTDYYMYAMNGDALTRMVKEHAPNTPVVLHSSCFDISARGHDHRLEKEAAEAAGADVIMGKNNDILTAARARVTRVRGVLLGMGVVHERPRANNWVDGLDGGAPPELPRGR